MKHLIYCLLLCLLVLNFVWPSQAKANETEPSPAIKLIYNYHPVIDKKIIPVITQAYANLGIRLQIIELGLHAELQLINQAQYDGDVIRTKPVIDRYENLVAIPTPLLMGALFLACQPDIECSSKILDQPRALVAVPSNLELFDLYLGHSKASIYRTKEYKRFDDLLAAKRFQYVIFVDTFNNARMAKLKQEYQVVELLKNAAHHVLHKKHQALVPLLDNEFKKILARDKQTGIKQ